MRPLLNLAWYLCHANINVKIQVLLNTSSLCLYVVFSVRLIKMFTNLHLSAHANRHRLDISGIVFLIK